MFGSSFYWQIFSTFLISVSFCETPLYITPTLGNGCYGLPILLVMKYLVVIDWLLGIERTGNIFGCHQFDWFINSSFTRQKLFVWIQQSQTRKQHFGYHFPYLLIYIGPVLTEWLLVNLHWKHFSSDRPKARSPEKFGQSLFSWLFDQKKFPTWFPKQLWALNIQNVRFL